MEGLNGQPLKQKSLLQMRYPNRKGGSRCCIDLVAAGLIKDPDLTAEKDTENDKNDVAEGKEGLTESRGPSLLQLRYPKRKGGFRCRFDLEAIGLINNQSVSKELQSAPEDAMEDMTKVEMISKDFEKMSASPPCKGAAAAAALVEDSHADSISSLIARRRKLLEEKKLVRRAHWKASSEKDVEERAAFERDMVYLPDLAWRKVFEYVKESKDKKQLFDMTELWRNLLLNERTQFLFPSVLPSLLKTGSIKLKDVFHCRLVCKKWKGAFENCLQQANKKYDLWETLAKYCAHFPMVEKKQESFLQMFPLPEQNPFLVSRSLILGPPLPNSDAFASIWQKAVEVDTLLFACQLAPCNTRYPYPAPAPLTANWHNLKHLGIATFYPWSFPGCMDALIRGIPAELESVALYQVFQKTTDTLLPNVKSTLKTLVVKQVGYRHAGKDVMSDPIENIQYFGPFPELKTLMLESVSDCPEISEECRGYLPSIERMEWEYGYPMFKDVLASFGCVNIIGRNLRHLYLSFWYPSSSPGEGWKIGDRDLRLHLPHLETLKLTFRRFAVTTIDFILPCASLKEFNLTYCETFNKGAPMVQLFAFETNFVTTTVGERQYFVRQNQQEQGPLSPSKDAEGSSSFEEKCSKEIIDFNGFQERMYESNVWEIIPDLRMLRISVITTASIDGESDLEKEKFYTSDGLKEYCGDKKNL